MKLTPLDIQQQKFQVKWDRVSGRKTGSQNDNLKGSTHAKSDCRIHWNFFSRPGGAFYGWCLSGHGS